MSGAEAIDDAVHEYGHHDRDEMRARRGDADLARMELARLRAIEADNARLRKGIEAVSALIDASHGVDGLHLNGDIGSWGELRTGGQYESWLRDFDIALDGGEGK